MALTYPHFQPVADHALLVELGPEISDEMAQQVLALDHAISNAPPEGIIEVVPALVNLLVEFDPRLTDHETLTTALQGLLDNQENVQVAVSSHQVDICYDAELSPDLSAVAGACGMSTEAVIAAHLDAEFRVGMYGFAPGYAYLTGLPAALTLPRKDTALRDVPAGSVIIAGAQCLVTTLTMPTGWHIIGRSPTAILSPDPNRPFLFAVGDRVRFNRINRAQYEAAVRKGGADG